MCPRVEGPSVPHELWTRGKIRSHTAQCKKVSWKHLKTGNWPPADPCSILEAFAWAPNEHIHVMVRLMWSHSEVLHLMAFPRYFSLKLALCMVAWLLMKAWKLIDWQWFLWHQTFFADLGSGSYAAAIWSTCQCFSFGWDVWCGRISWSLHSYLGRSSW